MPLSNIKLHGRYSSVRVARGIQMPLTHNLSTPETVVRYGFRSFVLTNFLLLLLHTSHDVIRPFTSQLTLS